MISARKLAALMLLAVFVSGCKHKAPVVVPVAAQAPPPPEKPIAQVASLPPVPPPETPKVGAPGSDQPPPPPPKPHRTRHKAKPATPAAGDQNTKEPAKENQPAQPTQEATLSEAPEASPIGQLTTAGDSAGTPSRHDILDTIAATEKGLNDLKRTLTPAEQETTVQIRTFLAKAKQALSQDDLDGAHTLATKAKVLLDELTKS